MEIFPNSADPEKKTADPDGSGFYAMRNESTHGYHYHAEPAKISPFFHKKFIRKFRMCSHVCTIGEHRALERPNGRPKLLENAFVTKKNWNTVQMQ